MPAFAVDRIVKGDADCNDSSGSLSYCHIQAAIDAAAAGETIKVYPGTYNETAAGRYILGTTNGPHQFGLFIDKNNVTIQGVDASGTPITNYSNVAAYVTTNATNNFGVSGIFVQGDGITISGLRIGPNASGNNKTIEVIGDNFTFKYSHMNVPNNQGALYFGDMRFDTVANASYIKSYTVEGNWFDGATVSLASGAGYSGPMSGRKIINNKFVLDSDTGSSISYSSGPIPTVGWYVFPVRGSVITGNDFSGGKSFIRVRGAYDNADYDWQSYWNDNTFDRAAITLVSSSLPAFDVRSYSYTLSTYVYPNVRRIGSLIQGEIDNAAPGDTVYIKNGTY